MEKQLILVLREKEVHDLRKKQYPRAIPIETFLEFEYKLAKKGEGSIQVDLHTVTIIGLCITVHYYYLDFKLKRWLQVCGQVFENLRPLI